MSRAHGGSLTDLRSSNRNAVINVLAGSGPLSRAEVSRMTGISRSAVSSLVEELLRDDSLVEDSSHSPRSGSGRPATLLRLTADRGTAIGVDIGHRHIRLAVAEHGGEVLAEHTVALDVDRSPDKALDTAAGLVGDLLTEAGLELSAVTGVGLGVPGPVDWRTGRTSSSVLPGWRGRTPAAELERRLGVTTHVDNDAFLGALGELRYGAARGCDDVVYVKVADGVGAGLVLDGRLYRGSSGIAGEIGHVQVREDGQVCRCGNRGCLESQVSVPKLIELLRPAHGDGLGVETVVRLAEEGDAGVNRVLKDAGGIIGQVLAGLCNMLNPSSVVIGGVMGNASALVDGVRQSVDRYVQPDTAAAARVCQGALGERAELLGALELATSTDRPAAVG